MLVAILANGNRKSSRTARNHPRPGRAGINFEHAKRRRHYQHFVQRFQICLAQQMNGLVHSIGQQDLLSGEPK